MSSAQGHPQGATEIAKFAGLIADSANRDTFGKGGEKELRDAGVDTDALPRDVLDLLAGLDRPQLDLLATIDETLVNAGFSVQVPGGGTLHYL